MSGLRSSLGQGRGQFGAAVPGAPAQDRARAAHRLGQPRGRLVGKLGAPGRDVEDRERVLGHRVANGDAGTDPLVKARAPVLGAPDQHRSRGLERGAHPIRSRRPFRPARPGRHVAVARAAQRLLLALDGQDPTRAIGDGDDAADALDVARDRHGGAAELGEHDLVLQRALSGRLVLRRRRRCSRKTRVHVVLLAAAIPRRGHFGSDTPHAIVPREESLARRGHRSVSLRITEAMTRPGLAHAMASS